MTVFAAARLSMPRHALAFVALALVLAILGVLGYKLSPLLFARADAGHSASSATRSAYAAWRCRRLVRCFW